ncbi:1-acyl-sn-glycerol-3-phosphate acyltransferase [Weizmannia acidilactici]|uniref:1-acyl-sn-glycerol-3-phosphate acyltransferase n=1 Tax=Weizmannia acidilactici TaxID=2607726 RepID=A0A5J4JEG6_9BACI|nr:1-acyl-sn-glycerol-3-phosphate acyltransferase [Weizmannia acidilactici]GER67720.1 1-acyl-sn-glycerol-3-phosphate acyltransferase [Weizmannia acidilactici]GER68957.1 1-acyl-sn-glycerol-3-phosphate acyltransferase [Weizmannia acidilactici]GER73862.1 1-acyl-sn-glycerol-3-phosphate acyltransferase [Weizmannia acidilactici]
MYRFGYYIVSFILLLLGGKMKKENKEKIPAAPFVVVCTHRSWLDIIFLALALWPYEIHYMAKQELFSKKWVKWLLTKLHAFPVNRENPGPSSLKIPMKILKEGEIVGIFPSGTRSSEHVSLKRGAVTIALKANVPLVPAVYKGPKTFKEVLKRKPKLVRFGSPILLHDSKKTTKEDIEKTLVLLQETFDQLEKK